MYSRYSPIRSGYLVGINGPGSITLTRSGISVLICGMPEWVPNMQTKRQIGDEERKSMVEQMLDRQTIRDYQIEEKLEVERFITPYTSNGEDYLEWPIPSMRFPMAEYCSVLSCAVLTTSPADSYQKGHCAEKHSGNRKTSPQTLQVPLVLACEDGHLDEIDWFEIVHGSSLMGSAPERNHSVRYSARNNVANPKLECITCGASQGLDSAESSCTGRTPWLPRSDKKSCDKMMSILERTSARLYYPNVFSALQIPAGLALDESLLSYLQADNELMRNVRAGISLEDLYTYKSEGLVRRFSDLNMNQEIFKAHIAYIVSPERPTIDRGLEFETLTGPSYNSQVLDTEKKEIEIYGAQITKLFDTVVAVRGLTETRVQTGFSRLGANAEDRSGYPMLWGEPTLGANGMSGVDWLPATRGRGEGIMLTLKRSEIDKWAKRQSDGAVATTRDGILLTNRLTVVHTLSHLLISVMAPRSGYALASIRERIYDLPDKGIGVLLYVTEADTLGTMGGLVRLAEPDELNDIVFAALNAARWCQLDPVCITGGIEHNRQSGACHQCCLLPETCCEYANQGLDRRALIGSPAGVPSAQGFLE